MKGKAVAIAVTMILAALLMAFVGCGNDDGNSSSPDVKTAPSSTSPSVSAVDVEVYFIRGEEPFPVVRIVEEGGARVALERLLLGPVYEEIKEGITTAIPASVRLNSYTVAGQTATVDFSGELLSYGGGAAMVESIIRQITDTVLANDPDVKQVEITVEGTPAEEALQP